MSNIEEAIIDTELYPNLEIEAKEDTAERLDEVAGLPTKYFLFATEFNAVVEYINAFKSFFIALIQSLNIEATLLNGNRATTPIVYPNNGVNRGMQFEDEKGDISSEIAAGHEEVTFKLFGLSSKISVKIPNKFSESKLIAPVTADFETIATQEWVTSANEIKSKVFKAKFYSNQLNTFVDSIGISNWQFEGSGANTSLRINFNKAYDRSKLFVKTSVINQASSSNGLCIVFTSYFNDLVYIGLSNLNGQSKNIANEEISIEFELFE